MPWGLKSDVPKVKQDLFYYTTLLFEPCVIGMAIYDDRLQAYMAGRKGFRYALHERCRYHFLFDQFYHCMAVADPDESRWA